MTGRSFLSQWSKRIAYGVAGAQVIHAQKMECSVDQQRQQQASTMTTTKISNSEVIVIGAGIVGLAVARELAAKYGLSVTVIEKEDCIAAGASSGNSGLGCTGYDAPIGSLERKLLRRSIQIHQDLYRSMGLSHHHVKKCGSLVVAWTPDELAQLENVIQENHDAGDMDFEFVSAEDLRVLEPSLSDRALGAVLLPHEAVVEPWLVPVAYAENARQHGATILTNTKVNSLHYDKYEKLWKVQTCHSNEASVGRSVAPNLLVAEPGAPPSPAVSNSSVHTARIVINCAGLHGDSVEKMRLGAIKSEDTEGRLRFIPFSVTPRKGQFIVFDPDRSAIPASTNDKCVPPNYIIEPVASQFTKGIIVWTTVYGNVVVGPTAVDTLDKSDRSTDSDTIEYLRQYGERVIPGLRNALVVGSYSGLRPATEHRDYQIISLNNEQWITVGGVRSTGLSAASGIGEYVGNLAVNMIGNIAQQQAGAQNLPLIGVTEASLSPEAVSFNSLSCPMKRRIPDLPSLSQSYRALNKETSGTNSSITSSTTYVDIFGNITRVTHPISSFGMERYSK